jgi:uncharacterized radical SAM superfamily Fe-S cluster-containing enzyme
MKLKDTEALEIFISQHGRIVLRQDCPEDGGIVNIYLTLDQFAKIEDWVFKNKEEIEIIWNDGIEKEEDSNLL